jgi:UDP-glucuronate 4-epimerase
MLKVKNQMKNILITGGAGFIGSRLAKKLIEESDSEIIIIDNFNQYYDPKLKEARINNLLPQGKFKLYKADITDLKELRKIFQENNIDAVIHEAAQAGVRYSLEAPFVYEKTNVAGTLNILECCKEFKVKKLVFASSSSVYGDCREAPFKESCRTDSPVSLYAATKKSVEMICHSYHSLYKIPMAGLRYFTVYGPWGRPDMALFKFTEKILKGEAIEVYGEGQMQRDFTYIDDIVAGTIAALEKDLNFEIFNLGRGNPSGLMDFIEILEKNLGVEAKKEFLPMQKGDVSLTYADISKAKEMLNWQPKVSLEEGVANFVDWYKKYYE